ncbi:MAG: hypothetical protein ACP5MD_00965 [Verrucomicrobiia bacterium]|uniref:hypothetical protein n=1 Tax=Roseiflexus castenholzii TaxID=120962 RepID=UPI003C7E6E05
MSNSTERNLDRLAAECAQAIIRRVVDEEETQKNKRENEKKSKQQLATSIDNTITKALGVLQENGVYACFLYLLAREKENGSVVVDEMLSLLGGLFSEWKKPMRNGQSDLSSDVVLKHITEKVTTDLERLLLAKETLEQMLIYARYGAKARE